LEAEAAQLRAELQRNKDEAKMHVEEIYMLREQVI